MDTIRPATTDPQPGTEVGRRNVKDITFLLGPPAGREAVDEMAEAAARVGVTPEELWIEMVRGSVRELLEPGADGRSTLDEMVSAALERPVTVWGVSGALHLQAGRQFPGLIIDTAQVLDAAGHPVDCDFSGDRVRGRIARALIRYTHADWAVGIASYPADELGFLSFPDGAGQQ